MNKIKYQWRYVIIVVMMILCVTFACKDKVQESPTQINYRLKWLLNTSVAGDIYADVSGLFADKGLQVTVKPGGPERDAIKELEIGHAQFGVASADQVIRARSKGSPIVVIAQLFQENPLQWIYRPEDISLKSPLDLKGKTIGITYGGNDETIMRALLAKYQISESEVKLFSVRYDYTPFYERKVDLWPVYRNTQAIIIGEKLRKAGEEIRFLNPAAFGIHFVANSVITTAQFRKAYPETVQKFIHALLQGWEEALDPKNREKAVAAIHKFDKDTPTNTIEEQLEITRGLIKPSLEMNIGTIDKDAWQQTEKIMLEQHLIPVPVFIEKILKP